MQESSLWRDISRRKAIITEPRSSPDDFNRAIKRFRSLVDGKKGAILLAVCRGKVNRPRTPVCS